MLTLADVRAAVRTQLANATAWPDELLDAFICDGIRMYSAQFPRRQRLSLALATGTQAYALPLDCMGVERVEHPAGGWPPVYLVAVEIGALVSGADVYALRGAAPDEAAALEIVFGPTAATGEHAVVHYAGLHSMPAVGDDDGVITAPEEHLEALVAFADFRGHWLLESGEAAVIDGATIALNQLGQEGRRAWLRYKEVMDRLAWLAVGESAQMSWSERRIY